MDDDDDSEVRAEEGSANQLTPYRSGHSEMSEEELIKFSCLRNAAYHEDFERFYTRAHKVLMFLVVALGAAALGVAVLYDSKFGLVFTFFATIAALVDLLWDVDGMARLHASLRRRCYDLLARLESGEPPDKLSVEFLRLVTDEPPPMYAVNALAFNTAVEATGRPATQKYVLRPWHVLFRHWLSFSERDFPERR